MVVIEMENGGIIELELYPEAAPKTVANFLKLVGQGFYDGLIFHRVIPGFMIQGGDPQGNGMGGAKENIVGEFRANGHDNPIKHERGVISMARTNNPNSASSEFFIMDEAAYRNNDPELLDLALNILNYSFELGWDKEYGGLLYFVDVENKPVQALEWDMKLWWPHNEMLIAFLKAYYLTNDEQYLDKYKLVHEYTFTHFKDEVYGEWYGYLRRDGSISTDLKGNIFKGPFHIPRCELEKILKIKKFL